MKKRGEASKNKATIRFLSEKLKALEKKVSAKALSKTEVKLETPFPRKAALKVEASAPSPPSTPTDAPPLPKAARKKLRGLRLLLAEETSTLRRLSTRRDDRRRLPVQLAAATKRVSELRLQEVALLAVLGNRDPEAVVGKRRLPPPELQELDYYPHSYRGRRQPEPRPSVLLRGYAVFATALAGGPKRRRPRKAERPASPLRDFPPGDAGGVVKQEPEEGVLPDPDWEAYHLQMQRTGEGRPQQPGGYPPHYYGGPYPPPPYFPGPSSFRGHHEASASSDQHGYGQPPPPWAYPPMGEEPNALTGDGA